MDNNKKSVFKIDQDLLQEFFNNNTSSYNGGGGNSFYESDHESNNILRYSGFGGSSNYYGNFDNYVHPSTLNINPNPGMVGGGSFLDDQVRNDLSSGTPNQFG